MEFRKITLEDKEWIRAYLKEAGYRGCQYSFGTMILWKDTFLTGVADYAGTLCYRCHLVNDGIYWYAFPAGNGDRKAAVEGMLETAAQMGQKLIIAGFEEEQAKWLEEHFPAKFDITTSQNEWDYVYNREDLATLAGAKYHGKRNHIARFKDSDNWHYEVMDDTNLEQCRVMSEKWYQLQNENGNAGVLREKPVLQNALRYFHELDLTGGVLYKDGELVAFTIGEAFSSDTYHVHLEKAYADVQGAYPMINQQYVLHAMEGYTYVNREEDDGVAGLRRAKESYYPALMIKKYKAVER
jgi:hypothetical protein